VLCVGTIERPKNQLLLVKVWMGLHEELGDLLPQLVLLGKYGWYSEEIKTLFDKGNGVQRIKQLSDANDAGLHTCSSIASSRPIRAFMKAGACLWVRRFGLAKPV
jgi:hypothetical protein